MVLESSSMVLYVSTWLLKKKVPIKINVILQRNKAKIS